MLVGPLSSSSTTPLNNNGDEVIHQQQLQTKQLQQQQRSGLLHTTFSSSSSSYHSSHQHQHPHSSTIVAVAAASEDYSHHRRLRQTSENDPSASSSPSSSRERQPPIVPFDRNPLRESNDVANRPVTYKSSMEGNDDVGSSSSNNNNNNNTAVVDDGSTTTTRPPGSVSYFPDQVAQISYLVAILEVDEDGSYIQDLTGGMDLLATELAPGFFPNAQLREVATSVNGWFPASCPTSQFQVCQDVSASIGLYFIRPDQDDGTAGADPAFNQDDTGGDGDGGTGGSELVDPATMTEELQAFQQAFEVAIANNELQDAIVRYDPSPSVYVVTDDGTTDPPTLDGEEEDTSSSSSGTSTDPSNGLTTAGIIGIVLVTLVSVLVIMTLIKLLRVSADAPPGGGKKDKKKKKKGKTKSNSGKRNNMKKHSGAKSASTLGLHSATDDGDFYGGHCGSSGGTTAAGAGTGAGGDDDVEVVDKIIPDESHESLLSDLGYNYAEEEEKVDDLVRQATADTTRNAGNKGTTRPNKEEEYNYDTNDEDSTIADLLATTTRSSDLGTAQTSTTELGPSISSEEQENATVGIPPMTTRPTITWSSSTRSNPGISVETGPADDGSTSVGSSGWSSSASPSTVESSSRSPLFTKSINNTNADSVGPFRARGMIDRELEDVASAGSDEDKDDKEMLPFGWDSTMGPASISSAVSNGDNDDPENDADDERDGSPAKMGGTNNSSSAGEVYSGSSFASPPTSPMSSNTFHGLDEAIMNGDWAAVGATAALMAASVSPPLRNRNNTNNSHRSVNISPSNSFADHSGRVANLDGLIEAGDWEGVMMVAAKYDLESVKTGDSRSARSRTSTQGSDTGSVASTFDQSSIDRTAGRSIQTSASQLERVQEIRMKVETLVRDVVPDEIENIDEMMAQFKGREEELLETLISMKERDVAKKARQESQKIARRNTRSRDVAEDFGMVSNASSSNHPSEESVNNVQSSSFSAVSTTAEPATVLFGMVAECPSSPHDVTTISNDPQHYLSQTIHTPSDHTTGTTTDDDATPTLDGASYDNHPHPQTLSPSVRGGSFEQATMVDPDTAATAAAEWAIQRSLAELNAKSLADLKKQDDYE